MCVAIGCTLVSNVACQQRSTRTTPQPFPNPASALFVAFGSCARARENMFHFSSPGLSLSKAGSALKPTCSGHSSQDRFHSEVAHRTGSTTPSLCRSCSAHVERDRQSGLDGNARSRSKAWLNRGKRRARFMSSINTIDCLLPNSPKCTNCWCPTSGGPHVNVRRR